MVAPFIKRRQRRALKPAAPAKVVESPTVQEKAKEPVKKPSKKSSNKAVSKDD
tara:strand:- start:903 stop:1061 length:159 start_codon:yes stop_codon:yes gene_type:complete